MAAPYAPPSSSSRQSRHSRPSRPSSTDQWELPELEAGRYRYRSRSLAPYAALDIHGRAVVEESPRTTLNNNFFRTRQNTPFLPPNSRLQLEQQHLHLHLYLHPRDHENTPRPRDSFVRVWRGDYETGERRTIDCDCDYVATQAHDIPTVSLNFPFHSVCHSSQLLYCEESLLSARVSRLEASHVSRPREMLYNGRARPSLNKRDRQTALIERIARRKKLTWRPGTPIHQHQRL